MLQQGLLLIHATHVWCLLLYGLQATPCTEAVLERVVIVVLCFLQVLDARDPLGTRCRHLEQHIKKNARHKHMLLLVNKCDLVSCAGAVFMSPTSCSAALNCL